MGRILQCKFCGRDMENVGFDGKTDTEYFECQKDDCGKDYVTVTKNINPPDIDYQKLFDFFESNHKLILTTDEINDIVMTVNEVL